MGIWISDTLYIFRTSYFVARYLHFKFKSLIILLRRASSCCNESSLKDCPYRIFRKKSSEMQQLFTNNQKFKISFVQSYMLPMAIHKLKIPRHKSMKKLNAGPWQACNVSCLIKVNTCWHEDVCQIIREMDRWKRLEVRRGEIRVQGLCTWEELMKQRK